MPLGHEEEEDEEEDEDDSPRLSPTHGDTEPKKPLISKKAQVIVQSENEEVSEAISNLFGPAVVVRSEREKEESKTVSIAE